MRHIYVKYDEGYGGHVEPEKQARVFSPRGSIGKDTCRCDSQREDQDGGRTCRSH